MLLILFAYLLLVCLLVIYFLFSNPKMKLSSRAPFLFLYKQVKFDKTLQNKK